MKEYLAEPVNKVNMFPSESTNRYDDAITAMGMAIHTSIKTPILPNMLIS